MPFEHGEVHWTELNTRDVDAAKAYYTKICGWSWQDMPMDDGTTYSVASMGDKMVAGAFDMTNMPGMEDMPPHWFTYFAVEDIDAAVKETLAIGGKVIRAPWDVPGVGRIAILWDSSGAALGLMTPTD